jgi:hypothetical protein
MNTKVSFSALFALSVTAVTTVFLGYIAHSGLVTFALPWLEIAAAALFYAWFAGWALLIYSILAEKHRQRNELFWKEGRKQEREDGPEVNRRQRQAQYLSRRQIIRTQEEVL